MSSLPRVLGVAAVVLLALPAWAATIHVTNGSDDPGSPAAGSLRDAIAKAQPGDTIAIDKGVTVRLKADLEIPPGKNLTIEGPAPKGPQATVGQNLPAVSPPARLIVKGNGTTVRQLGFDGVVVVVDGAVGVTLSSCGFDGKGKDKCVSVKGSTDVKVGTDTEPNSFSNGTNAVESEGSTNVSVTGSRFTAFDQAVNSTNDTNLTVSGNTMKGGSGVHVSGSSGTIDKNKITPAATGGSGVHVGQSPDPGPRSTGPMTVSGNRITVNGHATGVEVTDRYDVTVADNVIGGTTSEPGLFWAGLAPGGAGASGAVRGNKINGPAKGMVFDLKNALLESMQIINNLFSNNRTSGLDFESGWAGTYTISGNTFKGSGTVRDGAAMSIKGGGAPVATDGNSITKAWDAVHLAGKVAVAAVSVQKCAHAGLVVAPLADVTLDALTFGAVKGPRVFIETGGTLDMTVERQEALYAQAGKAPGMDNAPEGWGTEGVTLTFDADGALHFEAQHALAVDEFIRVTDEQGNTADVQLTLGSGTMLASEVPPGRHFVVRRFTPRLGRRTQTAEGTIDRPTAVGAGAKLQLSTKNVDLSSKVGAEAGWKSFFVKNPTPTTRTVRFLGDSPSIFLAYSGNADGSADVPAGGQLEVKCGGSAMSVRVETQKVKVQIVGGGTVGIVTVKLVVSN